MTSIDTSVRPFKVYTDSTECTADALIICTGAVARRLQFPGSGEEDGYWNKGISACAVCDGAAPMFRKKPIAVIGGGDSAMEEATFLTKYASKVYIIHRRDTLRASMVMQRRAQQNPKIEFIWDSEVAEACGNEEGVLGSINVRNLKSGDTQQLEVSGLFFAIGHQPATAFLEGQLKLDDEGYVQTAPGTTATSLRGVFAAGRRAGQEVAAGHHSGWHRCVAITAECIITEVISTLAAATQYVCTSNVCHQTLLTV